MDRYWRELFKVEQSGGVSIDDCLSIQSALGKPPATTARAGTFTRFLWKYFLYPFRARLLSPHSDTIHILDHSFAHLLRQVPDGVRKIVTVHDLAPLRDPGLLNPNQILRFRKAVENLHRADLLLADSEHTKRDIIDLLKISADKIRVLPLGANLEFFFAPRPLPHWWPSSSGVNTIFSIGSTLPRKNLEILPNILTALKTKVPGPLVLIRIGQKLSEPLAEKLRQILGAENLIERGHASEEEISAVYQHASVLLFPSFYEGFGLPLLEAMASGCPVVSSNASSLPEVGGDAALYFDPSDADAAATQVARIFNEPKWAEQIKQTGRARAVRFSWEAHFQQLLPIYQFTV